MKTYGNLWGTIVSDQNLKLAHQHAKKGKGWYDQVRAVECNISESQDDMGTMLRKLQDDLIHHRFHTSKYTRKKRMEGNKIRELYKLPYYPDRIAQWAVVQVIEDIFIKNFITDTYSAIPGRGIHPALKRLQSWMNNDAVGTQYCLKIDVRHYYQSINHEILKDKFRRLFKDQELLLFIDELIDSVETADVQDEERLRHLPSPCKDILERNVKWRNETIWQRKERYEKSLIGLPIGNYFSQYCGNFYFSEFDHWIKETLHIQYYIRYMDDIVILGENKQDLHNFQKRINWYFQTCMRVTMKDNWQIFPSGIRGIDYLGYRTFYGYTLLRKSTCKAFKQKMSEIQYVCENGSEITYSDYCSINSYSGWLNSCDHYRLSKKYIDPITPFVDTYYRQHLQKRKDRSS